MWLELLFVAYFKLIFYAYISLKHTYTYTHTYTNTFMNNYYYLYQYGYPTPGKHHNSLLISLEILFIPIRLPHPREASQFFAYIPGDIIYTNTATPPQGSITILCLYPWRYYLYQYGYPTPGKHHNSLLISLEILFIPIRLPHPREASQFFAYIPGDIIYTNTATPPQGSITILFLYPWRYYLYQYGYPTPGKHHNSLLISLEILFIPIRLPHPREASQFFAYIPGDIIYTNTATPPQGSITILCLYPWRYYLYQYGYPTPGKHHNSLLISLEILFIPIRLPHPGKHHNSLLISLEILFIPIRLPHPQGSITILCLYPWRYYLYQYGYPTPGKHHNSLLISLEILFISIRLPHPREASQFFAYIPGDIIYTNTATPPREASQFFAYIPGDIIYTNTVTPPQGSITILCLYPWRYYLYQYGYPTPGKHHNSLLISLEILFIPIRLPHPREASQFFAYIPGDIIYTNTATPPQGSITILCLYPWRYYLYQYGYPTPGKHHNSLLISLEILFIPIRLPHPREASQFFAYIPGDIIYTNTATPNPGKHHNSLLISLEIFGQH